MQSAANSRRTFFGTAPVAVALLVSLSSPAQNPAGLRSQVAPAAQPRTSQLPPNLPTALPQAPPSNCEQPPCNATPSAAPAASRPHRATVSFADGQLTVAANDSSLHQILRSIAVSTGMTINGGVAEQRVFGTYGPADPSTILSTLLDGTGVNMLLKNGPNQVPLELILTQRSGGPTPAPITPQDDQIGLETPTPAANPQPANRTQPSQAIATPAPSTSAPASIPQPANNVLGNPNNRTPTASEIPTTNSVPVDALPTPSTTVQTRQGIVDTPNPPPAGSTPSTADSIYQQLLQLQKAKAAASPAQPSTPPAPPQ
jgi:hypothetical protein